MRNDAFWRQRKLIGVRVRVVGLPALVAHVRTAYPGYFLRSEIASVLEVSESSLRRAAEQDWDSLGPSLYGRFGDVALYLYSLQDLGRLTAHFQSRFPKRPDGHRGRLAGHPKLWTDAELRLRKSRHRSASYWRAQERRLRQEGQYDRAGQAAERARSISTELARQYRERFEQAGRPGWVFPAPLDPLGLPRY